MNIRDYLLPLPRDVRQEEGTYSLKNAVLKLSPDAGRDIAVRHKLETMGITYELDDTLPANTIAAGQPLHEAQSLPDRSEAYYVHITPEGLYIRGTDIEGLFWGLVTLEQLINNGKTLPACRIIDWPEVSLRGHFDDISRKRVSKLTDFKRIIRNLSHYKLNCYSIYLEDMLHLRSYPDIGTGRGKLMPNEVREIVEEGRRNKVQIIPIFQLIGHCENLLAMDNYKHLGREVFHSMSSLDPRKPEVREFLTNCIREVCELFPGKYFGMGFDETQGIDKEAYVSHANWCAGEIAKYGKIPVFWADMLYNHWGVETLKELDPILVPVNWNYDTVNKPIPHQEELEKQGRPVWGFAGYSSWCRFLPDFERSKDHISTWIAQLDGKPNSTLMCSQWGDNGYENSRDLCWNLFAYLGESCWSGSNSDRDSFEDRFQLDFYGSALPGLKEIVMNFTSKLSFAPMWYWRMHRKNAQSLFRHAADHPEWREMLENDNRVVEEHLVKLQQDIGLPKKEKDHLVNFLVSMKLLLLVIGRVLFACRHLENSSSDECQKQAEKLISQIFEARDYYAEAWLKNNKRENIEVSLSVFNEVATSYESLISSENSIQYPDYVTLDISGLYNTNTLDIAGIPIEQAVLHAVPFRFADTSKTHVALAEAGKVLEMHFNPSRVSDIHLVATAAKPKDEKPVEALEVKLLSNGTCVHSSRLKLITHLCDWWAPLGEHMWAGGGYRHADKNRVSYLIKPDDSYGLMRIHSFLDAAVKEVDTITIKLLIPHEVQIFAITLEKPRD